MNIKQSVNNYHAAGVQQQPVNKQLRQQLAMELFVPQSSTAVSWAQRFKIVVFSSGLVTALVAIVIFVMMQGSSTEQLTQVFNPTQALADSVKNTFGQESFAQTFGLGNPNQFRYRKFEVTQYNVVAPTSTEVIIPKLKSEIELWGYQANGKIKYSDYDYSVLATSPVTFFSSSLISKYDQQYCYPVYADFTHVSNYRVKCRDFEYIQQQAEDQLTMHSFSAITAENILTDLEIDTVADPIQGPIVTLQWTTTELLSDHRFVLYSNAALPIAANGMLGQALAEFEPEFDGTQYHYRIVINKMLNQPSGLIYFQVLSTDGNSAIFQYNTVIDELTQIDYSALLDAIRVDSQNTQFMNTLYNGVLQPVLFIQQHPDQFTHPILATEETYRDQSAIRLRFKLSEQFDPAVMPSNFVASRYVDIWLNPASEQILAYQVLDDAAELLLKVEIAADQVITDQSPEDFFTADAL